MFDWLRYRNIPRGLRARVREGTTPPTQNTVIAAPICDLPVLSKQADEQAEVSGVGLYGVPVEFAVNSLFDPWLVNGVTVYNKLWIVGDELAWSFHEPVLAVGRKRFTAFNVIEVQDSIVNWAQHWYSLDMPPETVAHLLNVLHREGWQYTRMPVELLERWMNGTLTNLDINGLSHD